MQLKILTLPYKASLGGFDDEPLRVFLADKEVLRIDSQLFVKDGLPHWTVLVAYTLCEHLEVSREKRTESTNDKEAWRKRLGYWGQPLRQGKPVKGGCIVKSTYETFL